MPELYCCYAHNIHYDYLRKQLKFKAFQKDLGNIIDILQSLLRLAPRKSISTPKKLADHSKKQLLIDSTVTIMSANRKWPGYLASLNTLSVKDIYSLKGD